METKTVDPSEICQLGLVEVGERIASRRLSSVEVTTACLNRIEVLDRHLRSFAWVTSERALEQATAADQEIAAGVRKGPLHGVPIALKDLVDVEGIPTMAGMPLRLDHVAAEDATVAARLKAAGAVILGKLQMTEGALSLHHPDVAAPVNPWGAELWAGVSSSGSGVATAAQLCFGSLGSDTLGSIRFPSTMNGTTGLKPTWGRVSRAGVVPLAASLDHIGPMTRSVRDAAAMLAAIAGRDAADPTSSSEAVPDYLAELDTGVDGLRIGLDRTLMEEGADNAMIRITRDAERTMSDLGARTVEVKLPPVDQIVRDSMALCAVEAAAAHAETFPSRRPQYGDALAKVLEQGLATNGLEVAEMWQRRLAFRAQLSRVFEEVELLVLPAMNLAAPTIEFLRSILYEPEARTARLRFTSPFTMSGHPCLAMPGGVTDNGHPLGFQFVGRHFGESELLAAGHAYQGATDWHQRRPAV